MSVGADGLTVDLGAGSLGGFAGGEGVDGLPQFGHDGAVSLQLNELGQLTEINGAGGFGAGGIDALGTHADTLAHNLDALINAGIDDISIEQISAANVATHFESVHGLEHAISAANQDHLGAGSTITTADAQAIADHSGTAHPMALEISDAQAQALVGADSGNFSFTSGDDAAVLVDGAHSTHLSTSLKELQKLNIDAVSVGADGLTVDLGGSIGFGLHDAVAGGLPQFGHDGPVTLELGDLDTLLSDTHLNTDAVGLASSGIDRIAVDLPGSHTAAGATLSTLFNDSGAPTTALNQLAAAASTLAAHGLATQIEAGHNLPGSSALEITEAQANTLLSDSLSFVAHDNIELEVTDGNIDQTLENLQDLGVDAIEISGGTITAGVEHVSIELGDLSSLELRGMPNFILGDAAIDAGATSLEVTLNMTAEQKAVVANNHLLMDALKDSGVSIFDPDYSYDPSKPISDWMDLSDTAAIYNYTNVKSLIGINGGSGPSDVTAFDLALANDFRAEQNDYRLNQNQRDLMVRGVELLSRYTTADKMGDLITALTASGVSDMVVHSGNVQISDGLAAALVDAGMLQALPAANLVIDATSLTVTNYTDNLQNFAAVHLDTSLKSMADLGVNGIQVAQGVNKVYIDLGLPVNDPHIMADIKTLLQALDPSADAKLVNGTDSATHETAVTHDSTPTDNTSSNSNTTGTSSSDSGTHDTSASTSTTTDSTHATSTSSSTSTPSVTDSNALAKSGGSAVSVSLAISADMAKAIGNAGGLDAADLAHLNNLGIKEIVVVTGTAAATTAATTAANTGTAAATTGTTVGTTAGTTAGSGTGTNNGAAADTGSATGSTSKAVASTNTTITADELAKLINAGSNTLPGSTASDTSTSSANSTTTNSVTGTTTTTTDTSTTADHSAAAATSTNDTTHTTSTDHTTSAPSTANTSTPSTVHDQVVAQTPVPLPEVTVIGTASPASPLFDDVIKH